MASASEVGSYRIGVANLLGKLVGAVGEIEMYLDVDVEGDEASARALCDEDPAGIYRLMCAGLLRKAKIHMIAVLRANKTNNVHSLAVQMRPALECAGQVVLVFHSLLIEPERGARVVLNYMNADYYRTMIGLTKGEVSHDQLLAHISKLNELSQEEVGEGRSLRQSDKVAQLQGGKDWYNLLSEHFCHGKADWRGSSWQGGGGPGGPQQLPRPLPAGDHHHLRRGMAASGPEALPALRTGWLEVINTPIHYFGQYRKNPANPGIP